MTSRNRRGGRRTVRALAWVLLAVVALCPAGTGRAQAPAEDCPSGNLLASGRCIDSLDVSGMVRSALDDSVLAEGAPWRGVQGIEFLSAAGSLTFDLGATRTIGAAYVQADAPTRYSMQVSDDGATFREVWAVPDVRSLGPGLRARFSTFADVRARYVRFGEASGVGIHSLTELQVFCEIPLAWPSPLAIAAPATPPRTERPWYQLTRGMANQIKMILALLGAALLLRMRRRRGEAGPNRFRLPYDLFLALLGVLGFTGYYNWGGFHYPSRIHNHEFFHYYVGAKYFPELGYTGLYEGACLAEAEQGYRRRVELRVIRNLTQNELVPATYVFADSAAFRRGFTRPFTPARWEEFKHDIAYFRERCGIVGWEKALQDHGYNPSPAWNMMGSLFANLGPASDGLVEGVLAWIDPILLLLTFGLVTWAFGWRIACIAALFFGTNDPALYYWTGGAFLRQDWFFWAMAGICLLRRGRYALGGAGLAVSTLLRVFPVGFFAAIGLRMAWTLVRERRLDPAAVRIVAGAALATALVVPASGFVAGGMKAWPEFVHNTRKHADSPLTNYMGLRTLVGFRWETRQKVMYDPRVPDPFRQFREARHAAFRGLFGQPLFVALACGYLALLFFGLRREMEWWVLAAFGFGVIAVCMELTCYYFSFLMAAAFLWEKRPSIPIGLLFLSAVGHVITSQTYFYDIRYAAQSVAVIAFVIWATWTYGRGAPGAAPTSRPLPAA